MSLSPSQRKLQRPHLSNVTAWAPREAASSDLVAQLWLTLGLGADLYNQVIAKQLCNKRTNFYWKDLAKSQQWARWELEQSASSTILIHVHASHDSIFFIHNLCNQWFTFFVHLAFNVLICMCDTCSFETNKSDLTQTTYNCVRVEVWISFSGYAL